LVILILEGRTKVRNTLTLWTPALSHDNYGRWW
jgi:hypothetical protein